ncbi:hypothetical protein B0T25DRAFT_464671, partial [Lasiosphaeria hispida]
SAGWDPLEMDPKVTYDKVMEAIGGITQGGMIILIKELNTLQRDNFKTLHDLINRIEFLRSQLNQLGCPYKDKQIMAIHLIALQSSYPKNYDYWMRTLEADNLSLQGLIKELIRMANEEETNPVLTQIEVQQRKAKKEDDKSKPKNSKRVKCNKCDAKIGKTYTHCKCGKHYPKDRTCYWCEPEKAPDSWQNKAKARELKAKSTSGTTALVVHNSSGTTNPSTSNFQVDGDYSHEQQAQGSVPKQVHFSFLTVNQDSSQDFS